MIFPYHSVLAQVLAAVDPEALQRISLLTRVSTAIRLRSLLSLGRLRMLSYSTWESACLPHACQASLPRVIMRPGKRV